MSALSRRSSLLAVLIAALAVATGAQSAAGASSYKTCALSERDQDPPGEKPTYNFTLKRIGASCKTARKVMYAYHGCRARTSITCSKTLLSHWRCRAKTTSSIPTAFYATFTCKYGDRRVKGTYQQNP